MHSCFRVFLGALLALAISPAFDLAKAFAEDNYAIAMHGAPALAADFHHMPYANPDAPKGGRLVQGVLGTIDSLMSRGHDEAFTLYGLLANRVETDDPRSYVTFHLHDNARFSDGKPVTAEDVLFSWALL